MLNKCTDKVWFVVELCESIKAFKVELANFELYSSVPKDLRISMGNVFPGRDKDWSLLGEFVAEEDRTVQTFVSLLVDTSSKTAVEVVSRLVSHCTGSDIFLQDTTGYHRIPMNASPSERPRESLSGLKKFPRRH